jgi:predicted RNA-binding protein with PIN domain
MAVTADEGRLSVMAEPPPTGDARLVLIDAMNVIGSIPDGWWRDRAGAQRRLADRVVGLPRGPGVDVVVVFEGRPVEGLAEGPYHGIRVAWARRHGRNAADDRIVEEVEGWDGPVDVVTSDRDLGARVRNRGGNVVGPARLADAVGGGR